LVVVPTDERMLSIAGLSRRCEPAAAPGRCTVDVHIASTVAMELLVALEVRDGERTTAVAVRLQDGRGSARVEALSGGVIGPGDVSILGIVASKIHRSAKHRFWELAP
jgi:hypothetical protein